MVTDIFIRTYEKDLGWLRYCLKSIHKYVTGYRQIVICIPEPQKRLLDSWNLTAEKVVTCPVYKEDYLGQQVSKLQAYKYTDAEAIVFVDSDCCFKSPVDLSVELFEGELPIVYKTVYEHVGDAICWKEITEKTVGANLEYEYMRRLPFVFLSKTLKSASLYINILHDCNISDYVMRQPGRHFSEFNYLGAYAELNEKENYRFKDTEKEGYGNDYLKQNWSWGSITPEIKAELEAVTA